MKKLFRALSLCLTLALCVSGSTAALAEAPAATPAPQDERVITDVSPLEDQIRNIVGFTTSTGGPYDFEQADHRSAMQAYSAEPAEGAVALLRVYARAEDRGDASINSSGHSFLSVRNVSDHDIEVGGLRIAPDTEMTFSPRGNRWEHTGIWYNLEGYYKRYLADSYYQNIYAVQTSLDQGQLDVVNRNLAKSDHWSAYFNCAAFTESMWNAVCADTLSAGQPYTPENLRNVSDHDIEVGGLRIAPDTEMTFSPRGNRWEHTGIWYNLEGYYKRYLADSYYQNIYAVQTSLDQGQLDVVNRNLAKSDHWSAYFNCAAFTESMWNAVCADTLSAGQPYTPENLRNDILAKYGALAAYNPQVPYDYIVYYGTSLTPSKEFA